MSTIDNKISDFGAIDILREDGMQLKYMDVQSYDMCMEAVTQNPEALQFVKDQHIDVCLEATRFCKEAIKYARDPITREALEHMPDHTCS